MSTTLSINRDDQQTAAIPQAVREQLERILSSSAFVGSKKLGDFLRFITERTLAGESDSITQDSIAREVYGRDHDFNPSTHPLVRVEASRLRKSLGAYYDDEGRDDPLLFEVPLRTYTPVFSTKVESGSSQQLQGTEAPQPQWQLPAIGVLPFDWPQRENMESLRLEEVLTADLSQFPTVRALAFSRTTPSVNARDPLEQARARALDFVFVGAVRQTRERLRLDIALLDVEAQEQIWTGRHETGLSDDEMFEFPYIVAGKTAAQTADACGAIMIRMSAKLRKQPQTQAALYEAAIRFFEAQMSPGAESLDKCLAALHEAAPISGHSADYYAMLGFCQIDATIFVLDAASELEIGLSNVRLATAMDPTSAIVQFARAFAAMISKDVDSLLDASNRMIECQPNSAFLLGAAGFFLATVGEYDIAMEHYRESLALNSRHPAWFHLVPCFNHIQRGEYELALRAARLIGLNDLYYEQLLKASLLGYLGRLHEASIEHKRLTLQIPDFNTRPREVIGLYALTSAMTQKIERGLELAKLL